MEQTDLDKKHILLIILYFAEFINIFQYKLIQSLLEPLLYNVWYM